MAQYVIIEAANAKEANRRAADVGIYFFGVANGMDCECCGDRWSKVEEYEALNYPNVHGKDRNQVRVHYADGRRMILGSAFRGKRSMRG